MRLDDFIQNMDNKQSQQIYKNAQTKIQSLISELNYPAEHPLCQLTEPGNQGLMVGIVLLYLYIPDEQIFTNILKKCRSVENGSYSFARFLQNFDEVLILQYLFLGTIEKYRYELFLYEPEHVYTNGSKLEFSFKLHQIPYMINCEVKTISCDIFQKENKFFLKDGMVLIKPFLNDTPEYKKLQLEMPDAVELKNSSYYTPLKTNICKIIKKFSGKKNVPYPAINIGFVCIHFSTSIEEFYTYLFHKEKGIFYTMDWGNLDALVLMTADARNDIILQNIYEMGYIQTVLLNDTPDVRQLFQILRLDNYIAEGNFIPEEVLREAQKVCGCYKTVFKDGYLLTVPFEASEEAIADYLAYLKRTDIRYE